MILILISRLCKQIHSGLFQCSVKWKQTTFLFHGLLYVYENEIRNSRAGCAVDGEFKGLAAESEEFIGHPSHD